MQRNMLYQVLATQDQFILVLSLDLLIIRKIEPDRSENIKICSILLTENNPLEICRTYSGSLSFLKHFLQKW